MMSTNLMNGILVMMLILFLLSTAVILVTPVTQEPELLFEKDNCKTYAYYDRGNRHRYTTCENSNEEPSSKIAPNT
jgi:hypothetical protein